MISAKKKRQHPAGSGGYDQMLHSRPGEVPDQCFVLAMVLWGDDIQWPCQRGHPGVNWWLFCPSFSILKWSTSGCCETLWNHGTATRHWRLEKWWKTRFKRCTWYLYCGLQVPESQAEMCADCQCFATSTKRAAVKFELFIDGSIFW